MTEGKRDCFLLVHCLCSQAAFCGGAPYNAECGVYHSLFLSRPCEASHKIGENRLHTFVLTERVIGAVTYNHTVDMKKFFLFVLSLFIAHVINAQWQSPHYYPADELRGEEAYYANQYVGNAGYFVSWSNESKIKIGTSRGIFDYHDNYVTVIVGFYVGDELEEKVTTEFFVPNGDSDTAYTSGYRQPRDLGGKIINHLKTKGKVRFIASKYSGADFDLTVPMNKNLK